MLDQNWIRDNFISIDYPIGTPSKLYKDNQSTIKRVMTDRITNQAITLDVLINSLHEPHLRKKIDMLDTKSNTQLSDLNSKPNGEESISNIIDGSIVSHLYPLPRSLHNKLIFL